MKNEKDIKLDTLKQAYKELKESKMVLAPKHISKLLKVVAENEAVYNLIAERILGYDFNGEYQKLIQGEREILEITETEEVIPFVFCLLNEIDNQKIETVAFIRQTLRADTEDAFREFCEKFVGSFVNEIVLTLCEEEEPVEEEDPTDSIEKIFASGLDERVRYIVSVITEKIAVVKKVKPEIRKDLDIVCFSIDLCLSLAQFAGVFGLLSGLKYILIPLKKFKAEITEIDLILDSINEI